MFSFTLGLHPSHLSPAAPGVCSTPSLHVGGGPAWPQSGREWKAESCDPRHSPSSLAGCLTCTLRHSQVGKPLQTKREAGFKNWWEQILAEEGKHPGKGLLINSCMGEGILVVCLCSICRNSVSMRPETLPFVLTVRKCITNHP